jgi:diketogulonate reductase-like aldo/keto reductase
MHYITTQNTRVPALGLGTWQAESGECYRAVLEALAIGYRHIDTAQIYGNEEDVGRAIKDSDTKRTDIWLTTKVWRDSIDRANLARTTDESLKRLGTDYVDLLLIHWPNPQIPLAESIEALLEVQRQGKAKHIGVSNFNTTQIAEAQSLAGGILLTNQVEYHPFLNQDKVHNACREANMFLTAYCPLARGLVVENAILHKIAAEHNKTAAQVALRWAIQSGGQQGDVCAIPKSVHRERLEENFDIFDFQLSDEDMNDISRLKGNKRLVLPNAGHWDEAA